MDLSELVKFGDGYSSCGDGERVLGLRGFEDVLEVDAMVITGKGMYIWSLLSPCYAMVVLIVVLNSEQTCDDLSRRYTLQKGQNKAFHMQNKQ